MQCEEIPLLQIGILRKVCVIRYISQGSGDRIITDHDVRLQIRYGFTVQIRLCVDVSIG